MPKREFALREGGPKQVRVQWKGMWKDVRVSFDGAEVGVIPNQKALKAGEDIRLPDGSTLHIQLQTGLSAGLHLLRNGEPLPGTTSDPKAQLAAAYGTIYFVAGLSAAVGVAALGGVTLLQQLGFGWTSIGAGVLMGGLGYLVSRRSRAALIAAIVLFAADGVVGLWASIDAGTGHVPTTGIALRVFLIIAMARGYKAMSEVDAREAVQANVEAF